MKSWLNGTGRLRLAMEGGSPSQIAMLGGCGLEADAATSPVGDKQRGRLRNRPGLLPPLSPSLDGTSRLAEPEPEPQPESKVPADTRQLFGFLEAMSADHYAALGVSRRASTEEVEHAYERLAKQHRRDSKRGSANAVAFRRACEAREVLMDAAQRQKYDLQTSDANGLDLFGHPGKFEDLDLNGREAYIAACHAEGVTVVARLLEKVDVSTAAAAASRSLLPPTSASNTLLTLLPPSPLPPLLQESLIDLRKYHLGPRGARAVAACVSRNKAIAQLDLGYCRIGNQGGRAIIRAMQVNKTIKSLMLCHNELFTDDTIGDAGTAARLEAMDEESLLAVAEDAEVDGDQLTHAMNHAMPTAEIIKLIMESVQVKEIEETIKPLMWNRTLMELSLRGNNVSDAAFTTLSECLCGNDKLVILDLASNILSAHSVSALGELLQGCSGLRDLDLGYNRLGCRTCSVNTCQWCKAPMSVLGEAMVSSNVKQMSLGHNHLGDAGATDLMTGCIGNRALNILDLSGNSIGPRGAWAIAARLGPEVCSDAPQIMTLDLSQNPLSEVLYHDAQSNNARRDNAFEITARHLEPILGNQIKGVRYKDAKDWKGKKGKKGKKGRAKRKGKGKGKKKKGSIYTNEQLRHKREHEERVTPFTEAGWANACNRIAKDTTFQPSQAWVAAAFLRSIGLCEAFLLLGVQDSKFTQGALATLAERLCQKRIFTIRKELAGERADEAEGETEEDEEEEGGEFHCRPKYVGRPLTDGRSEEELDQEEQEFARILAMDMISVIARERVAKSALVYFTSVHQQYIQSQRQAAKERAEDMDDSRVWQNLLGINEEETEATREWIIETLEDLEDVDEGEKDGTTSPHVLVQPTILPRNSRRENAGEKEPMSLRRANAIRSFHPEQLRGILPTPVM